MSKDLTVGLLMDFYGQLLTDKQLDALDMYYNQDLSLAEIAEDMEISRQAVRDFIKKGEGKLKEYENKLKLAKKFADMNEEINKICLMAEEIDNTVLKRKMLKILNRLSDEI